MGTSQIAQRSGGHRRSIRIPGADYTEPGAYFVTMCAAGRREIFGRVARGSVALTALGRIAQRCLVHIPQHFAAAEVRESVIMPNHVHVIILLKVGARYIVPSVQAARYPEGFQQPVSGSLPTVVRTYKAAVTRNAGRELGAGSAIWQRNYFERVLRDGEEYAGACRYILENPIRWAWDRENSKARGHDVSCPYE